LYVALTVPPPQFRIVKRTSPVKKIGGENLIKKLSWF